MPRRLTALRCRLRARLRPVVPLSLRSRAPRPGAFKCFGTGVQVLRNQRSSAIGMSVQVAPEYADSALVNREWHVPEYRFARG